MGKERFERPMLRAGWGLLAALRQDLPAHPIHLCHNHMLLLGDMFRYLHCVISHMLVNNVNNP